MENTAYARQDASEKDLDGAGLPDRDRIDWSKVLPAFFRIMEAWQIRPKGQQILLAASSSWLANARAGKTVTLTRDQQDRVSLVLGIYKALETLFPNPQAQDAWMTTPNADFGGQRPLDRALGGSVTDLAAIRAYLDGMRGW